MPTAEIPVSQDAHIASASPTTNYGASGTLTLRLATDKGTAEDRLILDFDLSSIPPNATISTATLDLSYESSTGLANVVIDRLTRAWVEAEATWNNADSSTAWSTAGGDYSTPQVAGEAFAIDLGTPIDLSIDILALVEDAIANRGGLLSIILRPSPLEADGTVTVASGENASASRRPVVSVGYIAPSEHGAARNRSRSRARSIDPGSYT